MKIHQKNEWKIFSHSVIKKQEANLIVCVCVYVCAITYNIICTHHDDTQKMLIIVNWEGNIKD